MKLRTLWKLLKETVTEWSDDGASTRAAALAYYTIFSIAPMILIATAVAGAIFGEDAARGEIHRQLQGLVGETSAKVIEQMVDSAAQPGRGAIATVIGVVVLIFAATGAFSELQSALNAFWGAKPPKLNGALAFVRVRVLSFAMVLCIGFLLVVSLISSAVISAIGTWLTRYSESWTTAIQWVNQGISFAGITLLFALIYKVLPDRKIEWGDVWLGALVTSVLFNLGKLGIALYLAKGSVASSYGAAGSLAVLLVWVYYSSMILFLGAEFTEVYARHHGSLQNKPPPKKDHPWPKTPIGFPGTAKSAGGR